MLLASNSFAHDQSPVYEKHYTGKVFSKSYTVTNYPNVSAKYAWTVKNKNGTPASDWRVNKEVVKTGPGQSVTVRFDFKVKKERKLLVCSTLVEINNEIPDIASSVCSRLWLKRAR